jgi:hypothetical protein
MKLVNGAIDSRVATKKVHVPNEFVTILGSWNNLNEWRINRNGLWN